MTEKIFFGFMLMATLFACNKEEISNTPQPDNKDEHFVSQEEVKTIFNGIAVLQGEDVLSSTKIANITTHQFVKEIIPVSDEANKTAFYIINWDEGFVIISADNRISPVLAYSPTGTLHINTPEIWRNFGLNMWIDEAKHHIAEIRVSNTEQQEHVKSQWQAEQINKIIEGFSKNNENKLLTKGYPEGPDPDTECPTIDIHIGPLLKTNWGQGAGFNDFMPGGCNNGSSGGGKMPAGCVAVAMGQIMKYYKHPQHYSWDDMPLGTDGSTEISMLMADIGNAVNMQYGCNGSSANMSDVVPAFKNIFNYQNAQYGDYNYETLEHNLNLNRPVILSGTQSHGPGHAWVCDGLNKYTGHNIDPDGNHFDCGIYIYLHMNWGSYENNNVYSGWYAKFADWTYNHNKKMIYYIMP